MNEQNIYIKTPTAINKLLAFTHLPPSDKKLLVHLYLF